MFPSPRATCCTSGLSFLIPAHSKSEKCLTNLSFAVCWMWKTILSRFRTVSCYFCVLVLCFLLAALSLVLVLTLTALKSSGLLSFWSGPALCCHCSRVFGWLSALTFLVFFGSFPFTPVAPPTFTCFLVFGNLCFPIYSVLTRHWELVHCVCVGVSFLAQLPHVFMLPAFWICAHQLPGFHFKVSFVHV